MLIAHTSENSEKVQLLTEHSHNVAEQSSKKLKSYGFDKVGYLLGLLHDAGKSDKIFQDYIRGEYKGRVNHSSAGALWLNKFKNAKGLSRDEHYQTYIEVLQYVIMAHHGMFDAINLADISSNIEKRLAYINNSKYDFFKNVNPFISGLAVFSKDKYGLTLEKLFIEGYLQFKVFSEKNLDSSDYQQKEFQNHLITRYLLAVLKENDIKDSMTWDLENKTYDDYFSDNELNLIWENANENIEKIYKSYSSKIRLNEVRTEFSLGVLKRAHNLENGIFKLSLPTGAGKTQTVMRFATKLARNFNKEHIIYATSYLSVLGQNAKDIRNMIKTDKFNGKTVVIEHHSNVILEDNVEDIDGNNKYNQIQYLIESWDTPIVLTTMVQFFNTLMKARSSNLRRYANLANSIIILDEVQSIPLKSLYIFNAHMNFLARALNCIIIICTATQPVLNAPEVQVKLIYGNKDISKDSPFVNLIEPTKEQLKIFKRVNQIDLTEYGQRRHSTQELLDLVTEDIKNVDSVLIILNTKKAVKKLYEALRHSLPSNGISIYYLTTNQCATHRIDLLANIKLQLNKPNRNNKIIVISTQLIEAGVNIDFAIVYRSLAGLDSLIQAEGRCNREGKRQVGYLKVIDYEEENLNSLQDIKDTQYASRLSLNYIKQQNLPFDLQSMNDIYYLNYFSYNKTMGYPFEENKNSYNIYDVLASNQTVAYAFEHRYEEKKVYLPQLFKTAADHFDLIDSHSTSVIVPYNNSDTIEELRQAVASYKFDDVKKTMRLLQPQTINVFNPSELMNYIEVLLDGEILILQEEYYDDEIGLNVDSLATLLL